MVGAVQTGRPHLAEGESMPRHAGKLLLVLVGLSSAISETHAVGTVDLSWHQCSPIVTSVDGPVPDTYRLYASVTGQAEPHQAYSVLLYLFPHRPETLFPDAWRFDFAGCQGLGQLEIQHLPPPAVAVSCAAFQGAAASSILFQDYVLDPTAGYARLLLSNRYLDGVLTPNPTDRSFLLGVEFDHGHSVVGPGSSGATCGGLERDVVISLSPPDLGCHRPDGCPPSPSRGPEWLDMQEVVHEFAVGNGTVTFCGSCAPVPAVGMTWGAIKGQYRR